MTTDAQKQAIAKYDKENTVVYAIKLNRRTDADIIERLEAVGNRQGFIKDCIRAAMGTKVYHIDKDAIDPAVVEAAMNAPDRFRNKKKQ